MFNAGVDQLLGRLPELGQLDASTIRRLLSGAFLDLLAARDLGAEAAQPDALHDLRRLATALELEVVLVDGLDRETVRACAFVAAEALEIVRDLADLQDDQERYRVGAIRAFEYAAMEAGSLYLLAGYDANAAVAARVIDADAIADGDAPEAPAAARAARSVRAFLELRSPADEDPPVAPDPLALSDSVRWEVWRRIATEVDGHLRWLRGEGAPLDENPAVALRALADRLAAAQRHADEAHLALLLAAACDATRARALRVVAGTADGSWTAYVERRSRSRPLLWPAATEYAEAALPGPSKHAVVAVPTGAGKSAVAELAIAQSVDEGWVLYLAPTNALVAQILRDLRARFDGIEDVTVRAFLGGAEYTELPGEALDAVDESQILVMTPEKCSLALRQAPEAFSRLRLAVMDECHLLADPGSRGVIAELVLTEVLHRAPDARALLLSALVSNPEELAAWLRGATGHDCALIRDPWRPTRTLRAMLAIDSERANAPYAQAAQDLSSRANRREVGFEAPVALLANLQGAWSSLDTADYGAVPTSLRVPLVVRREGGTMTIPRGGYVNQAVGRVTHRLADSGHRVLTFLPANKHYSFSVARDLPDLSPRPRSGARLSEIAALLDLGDFELGVASVLRDLINRGIAVHTSAMLRDEQRASELAFTDGQAQALFATGTLAQGLNLPATAVVIGGTRVGDDRHIPPGIREERARAHLLNALGRAGRAYVAARSVGIVVPDKWVGVRSGSSPEPARAQAPFLEFPDASTEVRSQLQGLIEQALVAPSVQVGQLTQEEQTAFAFLAAGDSVDGEEILRRSFGAFRAGIEPQAAARVNEALRYAGDVFVELAGAPAWISRASHVAGLNLPITAGLFHALAEALDRDAPSSVDDWREVLVDSMRRLEPNIVARLLPENAFKRTRMQALVQPEDASGDGRSTAFQALDDTVVTWMSGAPLTDVAAAALGPNARGNAGRGSGNPLPKIIGLTEQGFGFGLSMAAGGIVGILATQRDVDGTELPLPSDDARAALDALPLAVRFGCDDLASTAWYRWGFRRRRIAHWLAELLPPPGDIAGDALASWVRTQRRGLLRGELDLDLDESGVSRIAALRLVES